MSTQKHASELESREVAEAAREEDWDNRSFSKRLFNGGLALDILRVPPKRDPEERERAERFYPELDRLIGDKPFLAGDALTAADVDAFVFVEFSAWIKLEPPAECANLARWHAAMSARPAAQR